MTKIKVKRSQRPARRIPAKSGPARRRGAAPSRAGQFAAWLVAALPISQAALARAARVSLTSALLVALGVAAHLTGVTAKVAAEWAGAVGRAGFTVQRVEVVGAERIDYLKIYDTALAQQNRSMAAVDLAGLRRELLRYGWIKDARVSRRLPDTLVIDIVERAPAAVWQHNRKLALIGADGVVLEPVAAAAMPDLPLLIGPGANRRSAELASLLDTASALRPLLAGAAWVGNRRWDLRFKSGELLLLPEGEAAAAAALARFAHSEGTARLLGRGILRFDMRDPAKFVLRLPADGQVDSAALIAAAPPHGG